MDIDRPHHRSNSTNNNSSGISSSNSTGELFICFTSRLSSSSSMKISSKSILSPGRCSREPTSQISLSNSLSRRLRTNGSMKGGQASPMFPANNNGKKRGGSFENPEPSSPKVTCIGQVRVKTKKQGRKMRSSRSQRRGGSGEVSFRRVEQTNNNSYTGSNNLEVSDSTHQDFSRTHHQGNNKQDCLPLRNQRWVHLPVTICEALRTFGAEFNCFLPCRSSCIASDKDRQEKTAAGGGGSTNGSNSCGAVFARWLVAVQENDHDGKGREIGLAVDEEEEEDFTERRRSYRRHVFEEIEFTDEKCGVGNDESVVQDEEASRVSICIPPKNALLLMRCRSDPVKMAALANKFFEPSVPNNGDVVDEEEDEGKDVNEYKEEEKKQEGNNNVQAEEIQVDQEMKQIEPLKEKLVACQTLENEVASLGEQDDERDNEERNDIDGVQDANSERQEEPIKIQETLMLDEETEDKEKLKNEENEGNTSEPENEDDKEHKNEDEDGQTYLSDDTGNISELVLVHQGSEEVDGHGLEHNQKSKSEEVDEEEQELAIEELKEGEEEQTKTTSIVQEQEAVTTNERSKPEPVHEVPKTQEDEETGLKSKERESQQPLLPDCLLLMMCEPKLSMEVSKETWVCSTDFIRWLPEPSRPRQVKKKDGGDQPKKRNSIDNNTNNPPSVPGNVQQPPRSSCSYPAKPPPRAAGAESMTTAIEKKLVGAKAYEPFELTRCKSEPMRSAAKLASEACFWKNRKLEPHRPTATLGIGAAGIGF